MIIKGSEEAKQSMCLADSDGTIFGIAGMSIKPGQAFTIDLTKGPDQLIWPSDGREITITVEPTKEK